MLAGFSRSFDVNIIQHLKSEQLIEKPEHDKLRKKKLQLRKKRATSKLSEVMGQIKERISFFGLFGLFDKFERQNLAIKYLLDKNSELEQQNKAIIEQNQEIIKNNARLQLQIDSLKKRN